MRFTGADEVASVIDAKAFSWALPRPLFAGARAVVRLLGAAITAALAMTWLASSTPTDSWAGPTSGVFHVSGFLWSKVGCSMSGSVEGCSVLLTSFFILMFRSSRIYCCHEGIESLLQLFAGQAFSFR